MADSEITIHDHTTSAFALKIRIILLEKDLPYKSIPGLSAAGASSRLASLNPRSEVPCLEHNGNAVYDSTIMAEYLDEAFPQSKQMLPPLSDPGARARVRLIEDYVDTTYEALNWGYGEIGWFGRAQDTGIEGLHEHMLAEYERQLGEVFAWLEEHLPKSADGGEEFFGGKYGFGLADAAAINIARRTTFYGYKLPAGSRLEAWYNNCAKRDSVKNAFATFEKDGPAMAGAKEAFLSGQRIREYRDHRLEWLIKSGGSDIVLKAIKKGNVRFNTPKGNQFK